MKIKVMNLFDHSDMNCKVYAKESRIVGGGVGLFAKTRIAKNDIVCTYGGGLFDWQEVKYMTPTYIANFENGKGMKIVGDILCGDLGLYANGVHPDSPDIKQNARFDFTNKCMLPGGRGMFYVIARHDIEPEEEIIVNYGDGYWSTMSRWNNSPHPQKSPKDVARDDRAKKRMRTNMPLLALCRCKLKLEDSPSPKKGTIN